MIDQTIVVDSKDLSRMIVENDGAEHPPYTWGVPHQRMLVFASATPGARGFQGSHPTLRGQRGNPRQPLLVSLKSYTDDIIYAAETLPAPCILLGHSLAGFAISAAAERRPDLFSMLIYLTAAVPKLGRSTLRDATPSGPSQAPKMRLGLSVTFPQEHADNFIHAFSAMEMLQARERVRSVLGIAPTAPSQLVINHLLSMAQALEDGDQTAALQALSAPEFTKSPEQTMAILSNFPFLRVANNATMDFSVATDQSS